MKKNYISPSISICSFESDVILASQRTDGYDVYMNDIFDDWSQFM